MKLDLSILSKDMSEINDMSTNIIFVDTTIIEDCISNLKSNLEELKSIKETFVNTTKSMNEEWKGEGAVAYEKSCNKIQEQIDASIKNLEDEIADLIERTDALKEVDEIV